MSRLYSIQARLLLAAAILLPLVFSIAGGALYGAYYSSLEVAAEERLKLQTYVLLGSADLDGGGLFIPAVQQEPRYATQGSGLYAAVYRDDGVMLWQSPSSTTLQKDVLDAALLQVPEQGESSFVHDETRRLFRYQLSVVWSVPDLSTGAAQDIVLNVSVLESDQNTESALASYTQQLIFWLSLTLVLALISMWGVLHWGLRPLLHVAKELEAIEKGEKRQLNTDYPQEIQPLTRNLNQLLANEKAQRERYRNTLGNLAHSLKTPLAVVRGAGDTLTDITAFHLVVDEQIDRMDQIVHYQLSRSVNSQAVIVYDGVAIKPLLERMVTALTKVYRDKPMAVLWAVQGDPVFNGDERDLMELCGNVLENAFKYGRDRIRISAAPEGRWIKVCIDDNGVGIPAAHRQVILQRGSRLDTQVTEGQGIGLSVAADIVSTYEGALSIGENDWGGARFELELPGGRSKHV